MEKVYIARVVLREKLLMLECINPLSVSDANDLTLTAHEIFLCEVDAIFEENSK
jgi:hypothetical protein